MSSFKPTYTFLAFVILMAATSMVVSCSSDGADDNGQGPIRELHLMTATNLYGDLDITTTRSFDVVSGDDKATYELYNEPGASLRVYITTKDRLDFYGDFEYAKPEGSANYSWTKKVPLDEDDYYIYGFMPSSLMNNASIAPNGTGYDKGAILTIGNVPALMTEDFSVVVGLKRAATLDGTIGSGADNTPARGDYRYPVKSTDSKNYIYILLDHLYSRLRFKMKVSSEYNQLRRINLKKIELTPVTYSKFNVTASLTADRFLTLDATYSPISGEGDMHPLFTCNDEIETGKGHGLPLGTDFINFMTTETPALFASNRSQYIHDIYVAPANYKISLKCTYDIYDTKGNLIRKDQTATNEFSLGALNKGTSYNVSLTVSPTYLYVLSEPDLDNPTIKITN